MISWLWTNPAAYAFASSEWGAAVFHVVELGVLYLLLRPVYRRVHKHFECQVVDCVEVGHPVHPTGLRACPEHHPHMNPGGHTAEEIAALGAAHGSFGATRGATSTGSKR